MTTGQATASLADIHRLLLSLREVQEQLTRGPRQIKAREQLHAQAQQELDTRREQYKLQRSAGDRKSLDLKTNEVKIADLKAKLNLATSNREYDIIRGQIDADTMANSVLQDEILEMLEKVDRMQAEIRDCEAKVKKADEERQRFESQFNKDSGQLQSQADELSDKISRAESGLTGDLLQRYRRLVDAYGADALAPVVDAVCGHCNVHITPQFKVMLNSGKVVFCGSCSRLLYVPPKS